MNNKIVESPDETPILYVLIVLGLLSFLATFTITYMQERSLVFSDITALAGIICAICALPIGLKLSKIRMNFTSHIFHQAQL